eukprot:TRINITY_DN119206_c0_g1_i1.p1 TRINITY_DN119206_c0_g1~~TRINITY_DN119206_c0_g1_i1.p1  ORF type:complete len:192 (-),score=39.71 TRINITY_DN119206_c0_g1_i1:133-636(-)
MARPDNKKIYGQRVFAGRSHSAIVTTDHRLYVWGHPGNRKLGQAGFNPDGTEAGEDFSKERPAGVAVRSALRDAIRRPRLVYAMLHRKVKILALGDECTLVVSGDGKSLGLDTEDLVATDDPEENGEVLEAEACQFPVDSAAEVRIKIDPPLINPLPEQLGKAQSHL